MTAVAAAGWSREQDKAFEDALAAALPFKEEEGEDEGRWEAIAAKVPGKTAAEVRRHYEVLVEDLRAIEAGRVPPPCYAGEEKEKEREAERNKEQQQRLVKKGGSLGDGGGFAGGSFENLGGGGNGKGGSKAEQERRKGIPWTEEEHKLFLLGLDKFGKGDWRSISRNFVISRTPTQVASHAQKYFIRLNSINRDRRRASIHDITSLNTGDVSSPQPPITGHMNPAVIAAVGPLVKHPGHPQPAVPAMGVYGPAVGQPARGHMVSAVGTPIMRPPPGHPPYIIPVAYPVPPPTMHP